MAPNPVTGALEPARTAEQLLAYVPKVRDAVDIGDVVTVFNKDSANLQPPDWEAIAAAVYESYLKHDAVVVTHGTDTMAYSASAVAFAMRKINKPVVFTGSQTIPDRLGSDAAFNLENAFRVALSGIAEVVISFGHHVHRAVRAMKVHESLYEAFSSPVTGPIMSIESDLRPLSIFKRIQDYSKGRDVHLRPNFASGILSIRSDPPMDPWMIERILLAEGPLTFAERSERSVEGSDVLRGIVFEALGAGNIPEQYHPIIEKAVGDYDVPVVVTSPFIGGSAAGMGTYAAGLGALKAGAISAGDMTLPAAVVKLSWLLAMQTKG